MSNDQLLVVEGSSDDDYFFCAKKYDAGDIGRNPVMFQQLVKTYINGTGKGREGIFYEPFGDISICAGAMFTMYFAQTLKKKITNPSQLMEAVKRLLGKTAAIKINDF